MRELRTGGPTIPGGGANDGALGAPEPTALPVIASSATAADRRKDLPPLYPSAARAKDCPPDSERDGLRFEARQHSVECQLGARRAFAQATRDAVAARRCGESARECLELAAKIRASHSGDDDSDAEGYETSTIDDALDDDCDDTHGDEPLATFHQPKLFTSPPTSCASQPSPRLPSWSEKTRPRSIGKRRCLRSGRRISTTYSQTILLVRELGQKLKQRCVGWWHITRYVTRHISCQSWRAERRASRAHTTHAALAPLRRCSPTLLPLPASATQNWVSARALK